METVCNFFFLQEQTIDFQLSNKELEVIYKLDQIRDEHLSFEGMLQACVTEMLKIIPRAELSFVLLYK